MEALIKLYLKAWQSCVSLCVLQFPASFSCVFPWPCEENKKKGNKQKG